MPQERLSKIWENLIKGHRVLGWTHQDRGNKHTLIPVNENRTWERAGPDGAWEEVRAVRDQTA